MDDSFSKQFVIGGFGLAVVAILAETMSGFGARLGFWDFRFGFSLLRWAAYGNLAALVFLLIGRAAGSRWSTSILLVMLIALPGFLIPLSWQRTARKVPAIHDITTDTFDPPKFSAILPLRRAAPNPPDYGGPEIAQKQREAYPDLAPAVVHLPPTEVFRAALAAAKSLRWSIVDANEAEGRIEATATTLWFGFKDDVVIRIRPEEKGSRVDIRSVSRVGKGDVGTNARRIRKFLDRLSTRE